MNYEEDTADLFVKFMLQLSVGCSAVTTLLALISKLDRQFPKVVLQKIGSSFTSALKVDDVLVAKLCIRVYSSLASCKVVSPHVLLAILQPLLGVAIEGISASGHVSQRSQAAYYLLATAMPWCAYFLASTGESDAKEFLESVASHLTHFMAIYKSPFNVGQSNAIFCENPWDSGEDETEAEVNSVGAMLKPTGAACGDSIWCAATVAHEICVAALKVSDMVRKWFSTDHKFTISTRLYRLTVIG